MRQKKGKKARFGLRDKMILILNITLIIALCLSYLAPYTSPKTLWPIAFLGLSYPFLLGINLCFIAYWVFRKPIYLILSLIAILIGFNPLQKHVGFHSSPDKHVIQQPDSNNIRVLTYNVHLFRQNDLDISPKTKEEITELVQSVRPDIVCMQEFYTRKRGKHNIRKSLSTDLKLPHSYFSPIIENEYEAYGLLILSKYPIRGAGVVSARKKNTLNLAVYADVVRKGRSFRIYNTHLQSIGFKPEDYAFVQAVQQRQFQQDNLSSTKVIGQRLKKAFLERSEQAQQLKEELNRCRKPLILTGDFNDTPLSYAVNTVADQLNNSFREKGQGWGITYNGDFPNFQIDYILSSKNFKVKNYQILRKKLSDHYAVWSDLSL